MKHRAVFFGTPRFAVPALEAVAAMADVRLVVSQPDREAGRGRKVKATPVKARAAELSIPVLQPAKLKDPQVISDLAKAGADFFFTAAYGKILPQSVLDIPPLGCINLHASLLPRYRGSAPIQWAVIRCEKTTGLTLMLMDRGMDTGPVLDSVEIDIARGETAEELAHRMSRLAPDFIKRVLPPYLRGELEPRPQDEAEATIAPMLKKEDGRIDWTRPASQVVAHILGMNPWPMAFVLACGRKIRILRAEEAEDLPDPFKNEAAGRVLCDSDSLLIKCGTGAVRVLEIQAEGKKAMEADCFLRGNVLPDVVT